jgi:hypothetical protein
VNEFDSAWWKWRWAVAHSEALIAEVEAWTSSLDRGPIVTTGHEYDSRRHGFIVRIATLEAFPTPLSLRLGDFVSNQRQCLDHISWAMVQRGRRASGLTEDEASRVQFPYAASPGHLRHLLPRRLPGAARGDVAIIRHYQPYQSNVLRSTLGNLARFSNEDKHRTIKEIMILPTSAQITASNPRDCELGQVRKPSGRPKPLGVGTEVAFVCARRTGEAPEIDVSGTIQTSFGITDRLMLDNWWAITCQVVCNMLSKLAGAPFALDDLPDWARPPTGFHGGPAA